MYRTYISILFSTILTQSVFAADEINILPSFWDRVQHSSPIVFLVLAALSAMSVVSLAIVLAKLLHLKRVSKNSTFFIKQFWESKSLNEFSNKVNSYSPSPTKEIFRGGFAELIRVSQLKEQAPSKEIALSAGMENMQRCLNKLKTNERRRLERFLPFLAICASSCPFIGLFGTVWGIMNAFEQIAATGNASLSAVAPGISEALIATAFGLAAAIPAVIGYNIANSKIRLLMTAADGFNSDFLNIVQRYLVTNLNKSIQEKIKV